MATTGAFRSSNATVPAHGARAVTPADGGALPDGICRALWVGGAGNVNVITADGDTTLFSAVPAGTILPVQCQSVQATSTTATLIVALY